MDKYWKRCAHVWRKPHALVGGMESNPGVHSVEGNNLRSRHVCVECGCYRTMIDREHDERGRASETTYQEPDAASLRWVRAMRVVQ